MNILQDVKGWAVDAEKLVGGLAANVTPIIGEIDDALKAINTVGTIINNFSIRMNTPAMQKANSAEKLQAFKDVVNEHLATGKPADEAALEQLESST